MISRVTQQTSMIAAQRNLQTNASELAKLQDQASSRKAFTRASEDPSGAAESMRTRGEQRANEQYSRNISNAAGWVTTLDSTLAQVNDVMKRVRDLTVQGANDGALSAVAKEAIAVELDSLVGQLLGLANTQYLGRSVFAGNSTAGAAFNADYSHTGTGSQGGTVERRVGTDVTVRVDGDGAATFGSNDGTTDDSVFSLVAGLAAELRSGTNIGVKLADIDQRMNAVRAEHSAVGSRHALILSAEQTVVEKSGTLEARRVAVEDIDLSRIILDLKSQEVSYQAALAVTARVLQPTLMDFLS